MYYIIGILPDLHICLQMYHRVVYAIVVIMHFFVFDKQDSFHKRIINSNCHKLLSLA